MLYKHYEDISERRAESYTPVNKTGIPESPLQMLEGRTEASREVDTLECTNYVRSWYLTDDHSREYPQTRMTESIGVRDEAHASAVVWAVSAAEAVTGRMTGRREEWDSIPAVRSKDSEMRASNL